MSAAMDDLTPAEHAALRAALGALDGAAPGAALRVAAALVQDTAWRHAPSLPPDLVGRIVALAAQIDRLCP
jgi:hypothetical protein